MVAEWKAWKLGCHSPSTPSLHPLRLRLSLARSWRRSQAQGRLPLFDLQKRVSLLQWGKASCPLIRRLRGAPIIRSWLEVAKLALCSPVPLLLPSSSPLRALTHFSNAPKHRAQHSNNWHPPFLDARGAKWLITQAGNSFPARRAGHIRGGSRSPSRLCLPWDMNRPRVIGTRRPPKCNKRATSYAYLGQGEAGKGAWLPTLNRALLKGTPSKESRAGTW